MRTLVLACALLWSSWPAMAEPPPPVCGRPAVLALVGETLQQAGRVMVLDPAPIGELSTGSGRLVSCAVRARELGYDTTRYAALPVEQVLVIRYTLELRRNGIFVRVQ